MMLNHIPDVIPTQNYFDLPECEEITSITFESLSNNGKARTYFSFMSREGNMFALKIDTAYELMQNRNWITMCREVRAGFFGRSLFDLTKFVRFQKELGIVSTIESEFVVNCLNGFGRHDIPSLQTQNKRLDDVDKLQNITLKICLPYHLAILNSDAYAAFLQKDTVEFRNRNGDNTTKNVKLTIGPEAPKQKPEKLTDIEIQEKLVPRHSLLFDCVTSSFRQYLLWRLTILPDYMEASLCIREMINKPDFLCFTTLPRLSRDNNLSTRILNVAKRGDPALRMLLVLLLNNTFIRDSFWPNANEHMFGWYATEMETSSTLEYNAPLSFVHMENNGVDINPIEPVPKVHLQNRTTKEGPFVIPCAPGIEIRRSVFTNAFSDIDQELLSQRAAFKCEIIHGNTWGFSRDFLFVRCSLEYSLFYDIKNVIENQLLYIKQKRIIGNALFYCNRGTSNWPITKKKLDQVEVFNPQDMLRLVAVFVALKPLNKKKERYDKCRFLWKELQSFLEYNLSPKALADFLDNGSIPKDGTELYTFIKTYDTTEGCPVIVSKLKRWPVGGGLTIQKKPPSKAKVLQSSSKKIEKLKKVETHGGEIIPIAAIRGNISLSKIAKKPQHKKSIVPLHGED